MAETPIEEERMLENNLLQYAHSLPLGHYNYSGGSGDFQLSPAVTPPRNGDLHVGMVESPSDTFYGEPCNRTDPPLLEIETPEETVSRNNEVLQCLEDYKCPICLDTFINTVKVDCSYGHKFCNYCIYNWIKVERHLVTECPVCRGSIFGKSLDLKTDAEIRRIYESLPEDEKNNRLLSIKERLQVEYPNSLANVQQFSPGYQYQISQMRYSDAPHHHFNRDLHNIPLMGVLEGAMQHATNSQENDYFQNFGENSAQVWPQGLFYPSTMWNELLVCPQNFQNIQVQNEDSVPQPGQPQPVDYVDVHHQHYRHQSHESSRWNNNLYLTSEDTITPSQPQLVGESDANNRQNHLPEVSPPPNYPFQSVGMMSHHSNPHDTLHQQDARLHPPILTYSTASTTPRSVFQVEHYPLLFSTHSSVPMPVAHIPTQPRLTTSTHLNGFYGCYLSACPGHHHCSSPTTNNTVHSPNSHPVSDGCSGHHCHFMPCRSNGCIGIGHTSTESNSSRNIPVISTRNRPSMSRSGTPQLSSSNCSSGHRSSSYRCTSARNNVSGCPAHGTRAPAHFSGGFSVFSSGYIGFQISHTPTAMMVGDRYVTTPTARLTHPLVSLIPLNQDGSSTRVCLAFEVHPV